MKIEYKKGKLIIPIQAGDTMLVGRFKNKAVKVKNRTVKGVNYI